LEKDDQRARLADIRADFFLFVCLLTCFGASVILGSAPFLIPLFFGSDYSPSIPGFRWASAFLFANALSSFLATHCFLPAGKDRALLRSSFLGAAGFLILLPSLAVFFQQTGAVMASICAELLVATSLIFSSGRMIDRSIFQLKSIFKILVASTISGTVLFGLCKAVPPVSWPLFMSEFLTACAIYLVSLTLLSESLVMKGWKWTLAKARL
jgi:O-antigen/teichoic acid export membrane protein